MQVLQEIILLQFFIKILGHCCCRNTVVSTMQLYFLPSLQGCKQLKSAASSRSATKHQKGKKETRTSSSSSDADENKSVKKYSRVKKNSGSESDHSSNFDDSISEPPDNHDGNSSSTKPMITKPRKKYGPSAVPVSCTLKNTHSVSAIRTSFSDEGMQCSYCGEDCS